jgi:putative colanic acid biosynthesis UDP-glucose lipid carrier transferase
MIDNAPILATDILSPKLTVVYRIKRYRTEIDSKRTYFLFKRLFDIVFSALFILCILSWLLPLLCLLIKLSSRGPVFFLQKRVGRGGKSFTCYKLRTMIVNAEADTRQASENDSRITGLGWLLRKSNMDEFPQFFNILKGDMSVIGPRPHMYADCRRFSELLPGYKFRNLIKPGLTGLAQVKGYHGPVVDQYSILMRYHWDTYYIHHIGWILDSKIILYTVTQRIKVIAVFLATLGQGSKQHKHVSAN